jgi:hypothetical protein
VRKEESMTPGLETEAAVLFEDGRAQDLAQFEPDPEGHDDATGACEAAGDQVSEAADDAQWVVWPDALDESLWAAMELRLYHR